MKFISFAGPAAENAGKVNENKFWDLDFQSLNFAGMQYLRFRADQLFDGYRMHGDDRVLIMTDKGMVEDILSLPEAGDDILYYKGILSPGFINCHCHLELSHMKDRIPENEGLVSFVSRVIKDRHLAEEEIAAAIEEAENGMIKNGIVAVGDICNNTLTIPQKIKGRVWYHNFIEASGFVPSLAELRFGRVVDIFKEYAKHYAVPVASNSIVPHAPYSVSEELWQKIVHFPGNQLLTMHNQESVPENELFLYRQGEFLSLYENMNMDISFFRSSGKSSLQTCLPKFLPHQSLILVHNVHTSQEDILFAMKAPNTIWWCLCPNANLYITNTLPAVELLIRESRDIVLGTDSLASNGQLSILSEMQTIHRHFPAVSAEQLFGWATLNGAKALQLDSLLGSFEKGKQPGVVLSNSDLSAATRLL
jgi:aminodeoxyfutalosine deaminase